MDNKENLLDVIGILYKWRKKILLVCGIAAIGSIVASLLLPVYYKATTTFLAAHPSMAKPERLFSPSLETYYYGSGEDIDRLLTISTSNDLVEFIIDTFNLYQHYDIDTSNIKASHYVREKFFGLYNITKTDRDALELSVEDRDRELSAKIANTARIKIDEIAQSLIRESQQKAINTFESNIARKQAQNKKTSDTLSVYRKKYGIYNSSAQTESLTTQQAEAEASLISEQARLNALKESTRVHRDTILLLEARVKGKEEEVKALNEKIQLINEGIALVSNLESQYYLSNESMSRDREKLKYYISTHSAIIPATILIEQAEVPVVKNRPVRSLIVIAATFIAFLFSILVALVLEHYKNVDWKKVFDAA